MRATEVLAEPLAEVTAIVLTKPARELYAWLWRCGVLEVKHPAPQHPAAEVRKLRRAS